MSKLAMSLKRQQVDLSQSSCHDGIRAPLRRDLLLVEQPVCMSVSMNSIS